MPASAVCPSAECIVKEPAVALRGVLDPSSVETLRATVASIPAPETIDMSGVSAVTSDALIEFIALANRVGSRKIVLLNAQPTVARLLRVLGLDRIFLLTERSGRTP
jgi:anti-anti-sigma regulatory factor